VQVIQLSVSGKSIYVDQRIKGLDATAESASTTN
jgi:hypothetical protein